MPDHHLRSYFWYIVDHPQLLKDGSDADTNNVNKTVMRESEHAASSGGALSLLGSIYESGDEDEDVLPALLKSTDHGKDAVLHEKGHKGCASQKRVNSSKRSFDCSPGKGKRLDHFYQV
jgi:hypothetical protein